MHGSSLTKLITFCIRFSMLTALKLMDSKSLCWYLSADDALLQCNDPGVDVAP